ncbi:GNAT family N-acetyltransferase [Streptomyces murinus]|uniref:Ribosomal protein S18 acetylase RimI-like enzyme n=1 Tax=Streptomyces murinus TaxID=33900 RepID=A0A7W3RJ03_STRMR|nr:GNAT family N-acetyltransferase [Streptomyces murinus]MBA9051466.1 ribosomal protein S18 acetylase RimI-like enzyme [Streptomyces murinus]UWW92840.1 GNAT family N-acetyltransferase [Streptomyces murinus]
MHTDVQSFAVAHLLRRPAACRVGGFVVGFDPATTSPYVNYATAVPGAEPTDADVADLIAAFRTRGLLPRLEFAPDAAPAVEPALRRAGFTTEAVHEYLVCTPATLTVPGAAPEPEARVRVEAPVTDEDYLAIDTALSEAFGGEWAPSPEGAARLRRTEEGGGAVRFVRAEDGSCAGGALCSAPAEGTAELAGVGTLPGHRGRGIAAAVTATLAETLFTRGARTVWLEYSGAGSRRVYERVGFRPGGTRVYLRHEG